MTMVVFSVFLGKLAKVPSDGTPYPIFAFAGLVPWAFVANGDQVFRQPRRQRALDHQGVLPAPARFAGSGLEPWRTVYGINPMAGVVEGFRWSLFATGHPPGLPLVISVAAALILVVSGAFFFRRVERTVADVV